MINNFALATTLFYVTMTLLAVLTPATRNVYIQLYKRFKLKFVIATVAVTLVTIGASYALYENNDSFKTLYDYSVAIYMGMALAIGARSIKNRA